MRPLHATVERELARIAHGQHGVVTRGQLEAAGVTAAEIKHRLATGALLRVYRGVYRVGHRAPNDLATYAAAVLACGADAMLSGAAGAHLLGMLREPPRLPEVTVPGNRRVPGIVIHRSRVVLPRDRIRREGIRVARPAWILVDIAADLSLGALTRACHEAGVKHRTTPGQVNAVLERRPTARGAANLRRITGGKELVTLSALERRFIRLLRSHGLPLPLTNRPAGGRRVDCRWPNHRLTVELDSYTFHNSRYAWERDRQREREARARGDEFRRFTYGDVLEYPDQMLAELRRLLAPDGAT